MAPVAPKQRYVWTWQSLVTPRGRIPRLPYFLNALPYVIVYAALVLVGPNYLFIDPRQYYLVILVPVAGLLFLMYCLYSKRFQDIGMPGWLAALVLAPAAVSALVNGIYQVWPAGPLLPLFTLWEIARPILTNILRLVGLVLLFVPGARGDNAYGPSPRVAPPVEDVF